MNLLAIPLLPLAAAALSAIAPLRRWAPSVSLLAGLGSLALSLEAAHRVLAAGHLTAIPGWVGLEGLGAVVLLLVTWASSLAALFSLGYLAAHHEDAQRIGHYCVHFNLFVFALELVPLLQEPAMAWIAVEFTAVFSVLLVAFDNTRPALEAAWKYIALTVMGAAIALLGFFVLFWAEQMAGGGPYTWDGLRALAYALPARLVDVAFLLILVGFGTEVGFVPLHTWLPDAHSRAPSPACALLSGVKTTVAFYAILRLLPLLGHPIGRTPLQWFGLLSVGTAAFLLLQVSDYKRLFAYSTIEHMGIILVAIGLGGSGYYAALLQLVSHSLTKILCFFAAGAALLVSGTREISSVRGLFRSSPATGSALLLGALAIGGAPPFVVFLSEFSIFRSALQTGHYLVTGMLVFFIVVAFVGILSRTGGMVYGEPPSPEAVPEPLHASILWTLALAALPVCLLGLCPAGWLHRLLGLAVSGMLPGATP